MAVVAVSFDGTILSLAQSASDNGVWDKANASQDPTQEDNSVWNGTVNQSNQSSNNVQGVEFEDDATVDFTAPLLVLAKVIMTTPGTIDVSIAKGFWYEVGEGTNGGTGTYFYYIAGLYAGEYPILKSWRVILIDPNEIAWRDEVGGTVVLSTIDYYAIIADTAAAAKTDNVVHARLDYIPLGGGLTLVGGDSTDPDGTLDDYIAFDFETTTNRQGIVLPGDAEVIVNGVLTIGSATATVYNDSNRILVFPAHLVGEGALGVDIGLANAANDINLTAYTLKGLGNATVKKLFDTALEVNGTTEVITIPAHGFNSGDLVTYSNEGGTNLVGLTTTTQYFVNALTADTLALYAIGATVGRQNAFSDTTRVGLTADTAPGANHSLTRDPDTRPDYEVTGTTGVGHTLVSCTLDGMRIITFTSPVAMTGGFILRTGSIVLGGGSMTGVIITTPTLEEGDALFDLTATALGTDLSAMDLTAGDEGHAVRVTAVGSASWNHNLAGYWAPANLGWNFDTSQAFTTEQLVTDALHGFATGDAVYYNDEGGVVTIGLTNGNKYYVNVVNTTTVTLHLTKAAAVAGSSAINLTTGAAETQSLYSSKATIFNDTAAGTLTVNVVTGFDAPSFRNADGATTVVNNAVTVEMTGVTEGTPCTFIAAETVGSVTEGDVLAEVFANSLGVASFDINYEGDLDIDVKARNAGVATGALQFNNVSFTRYETEAASPTGSLFQHLGGFPAVGQTSYFGSTEQFIRMKLDMFQANVGTGTIVWEYWDGLAWSALSGVVDGTVGWTVTGKNVVSWTLPGDWAQTTVDGTTLFFVRARLSVLGTAGATSSQAVTLDTTRYKPFPEEGVARRTITSTGLTVVAVWVEEPIGTFNANAGE